MPRKILVTTNLNMAELRKGEEKEVLLTKEVQAKIDAGFYIDITPHKPRKKKDDGDG